MVNNGNVMMGKGKGIKENKSAEEDGERRGVEWKNLAFLKFIRQNRNSS